MVAMTAALMAAQTVDLTDMRWVALWDSWWADQLVEPKVDLMAGEKGEHLAELLALPKVES